MWRPGTLHIPQSEWSAELTFAVISSSRISGMAVTAAEEPREVCLRSLLMVKECTNTTTFCNTLTTLRRDSPLSSLSAAATISILRPGLGLYRLGQVWGKSSREGMDGRDVWGGELLPPPVLTHHAQDCHLLPSGHLPWRHAPALTPPHILFSNLNFPWPFLLWIMLVYFEIRWNTVRKIQMR